MKILRKLINITMSFFTFFIIIYFIKINTYDRLFACISLYILLLVPYILNLFKIKLNDKERLIYTIFIFLSSFLGSIINLYKYIWWYDLFMHFLSGILVFILARIINKNNLFENKLIRFIYYIGFVALITLFWEVFEFSCDSLLGSNMQHNMETGVRDTMEDMIVALLGGCLCYIKI